MRRYAYLPKYSPDLNPIELPYSKFKASSVRSRPDRSVPHPSNSLLHPATQSARMRQLFQACRLCFNMTGIRFKYAVAGSLD